MYLYNKYERFIHHKESDYLTRSLHDGGSNIVEHVFHFKKSPGQGQDPLDTISPSVCEDGALNLMNPFYYLFVCLFFFSRKRTFFFISLLFPYAFVVDLLLCILDLTLFYFHIFSTFLSN